MIQNAITVDVEDYFQVSAFADRVRQSDWDHYPSRVARNTGVLLDLFDEARVQATFFVLGWVAERYPEIVREIAARGHDVACHGYSHSLVYNQSPAEFRQETARAKQVLEDIVQRPVTGYRAASYSVIEKTLWALDTLVDLGFRYDSSIFPVRHDRYGIPGAERRPTRLRTPRGQEITEFPMSTVELLRFRLPVSGGGYFRLFPYGLTRAALAQINEQERRPFIFYLHPWEIDSRQPRIRAKWLSRFRHYNNLDKCESRLRRLLADFRFAPAATVLQGLGLLEPSQ